MNTENSIVSHVDDVVFENRNKAYGAYAIRKTYHENLSKGSIVSFCFMALIFVGVQVAMMVRPEIIKPIVCPPFHKILEDIKIIREKPALKEFVKPQPLPHANLPVRVVTTQVEETPLVETSSSPASTEGTEGAVDVDGPSAEGVGVDVSIPAVAPTGPLDIAEVMPDFVGGKEAMYRFLRRHLHYPGVAQRIGQEGIVFVRFVVDQSGHIANIEIIKSVSGVLDKEAARVIALMPDWKPGMQHNSPVSVRMVLPIKFRLGE